MKLVELTIFWQNDTTERLQLGGVNNIRGGRRLFSVTSKVFEPHVGSRGARSNGIGPEHAARHLDKTAGLWREKPGEVAPSTEGTAEAVHGSALAACKQASTTPRGAKV